jgi:DNA-binding MarR family transcriptional regulator
MEQNRRMKEIRLLELMGDIYRKLIQGIAPFAKKEGLSIPEMLVLWKMHVRECRRVKELVADLGLPPSTLTGILDRLTAEGWMTREADPDDRRAVVMRRTEKLDGFLQMIKRESNRRMEAAFRKLPRELIDRLAADLTSVYESIESEEYKE